MNHTIGNVRRTRFITIAGLWTIVPFVGALIYSLDDQSNPGTVAKIVVGIEFAFIVLVAIFSSGNPVYRFLAGVCRFLAGLRARWDKLGYVKSPVYMLFTMVSFLLCICLWRFGCCNSGTSQNPSMRWVMATILGAVGAYVSLIFVVGVTHDLFDQLHELKRRDKK